NPGSSRFSGYRLQTHPATESTRAAKAAAIVSLSSSGLPRKKSPPDPLPPKNNANEQNQAPAPATSAGQQEVRGAATRVAQAYLPYVPVSRRYIDSASDSHIHQSSGDTS